uniref:Uncharacterized protein n=1 Tax=Anguilla anguilla TaxID=7936 RepID=A0A0E9U6V6_ANGAN
MQSPLTMPFCNRQIIRTCVCVCFICAIILFFSSVASVLSVYCFPQITALQARRCCCSKIILR